MRFECESSEHADELHFGGIIDALRSSAEGAALCVMSGAKEWLYGFLLPFWGRTIKLQKLIRCCLLCTRRKIICKLYFFYKKIHYFYIVTLGYTQNVGFLLF